MRMKGNIKARRPRRISTIIIIHLCLFYSSTYLTHLPYVFALGGDSIIQVIQKAEPSLVYIKSENVGLYGGQETVVKDEVSNRLMVVKPVGIARYARNGAGVILDASGIIVTNAHIVADAGRVNVTLYDQTTVEGKVILLSLDDDLAFIQIKAEKSYVGLPLAEAESIKLGNPVYNVGKSEVIKDSITEGSIIGLGTKDMPDKKNALEMVKINFDVYQGDSGGPVIDKEGKLVGLILAGSVKSGHLSLVIPANKIKKYYLQCLEKLNSP